MKSFSVIAGPVRYLHENAWRKLLENPCVVCWFCWDGLLARVRILAESESVYDRRSVSQYVLVSSPVCSSCPDRLMGLHVTVSYTFSAGRALSNGSFAIRTANEGKLLCRRFSQIILPFLQVMHPIYFKASFVNKIKLLAYYRRGIKIILWLLRQTTSLDIL
jgi:hypothetical protein